MTAAHVTASIRLRSGRYRDVVLQLSEAAALEVRVALLCSDDWNRTEAEREYRERQSSLAQVKAATTNCCS